VTGQMRLSILDLESPDNIGILLPAIDQLGYNRYWCTEHYSPAQSASPTVVAALAAGTTDRIRIGTGGVLLRVASVLRVAQDFAALEMFFPGRIDLGIASAMPQGVYLDEYAADVKVAEGDMHEARLARLVSLVRNRTMADGQRIGPSPAGVPEIWLCGTTQRSATIAARLGVGYVFHHYLASTNGQVPQDVSTLYRGAFIPDAWQERPAFAVATYGVCASNADAAHSAWSTRSSNRPSFHGAPEECVSQISGLADAYAADEVFIDNWTTDIDTRIDGLSAIAQAAGMV